MSFAMTIPQIEDRSKTVTRRIGWLNLRVGDHLRAVEKAMGLGAGGKVKQLAVVEVIRIDRQRLDCLLGDEEYGTAEVEKEGFPEMSPREFVKMFCEAHECEPWAVVTRIEFKYGGSAP